jgi:ATP-dependent Clp protease, protease subunit
MPHPNAPISNPCKPDDDDCDCGGDDSKDSGKSELSRLLRSRTLIIQGPIEGKLGERIIRTALILEDDDPDKPINVVLNSPGGSVTEGLAIYDMLRFVKPRVRILCAGLCASIATIILLAADKKDRLTLPNSRFLIHQPLIMGEVVGPASDLEITANEILKTRELINQMIARETGQPKKRVEKDTQRDYWLTAEEAVEYGLIASIVDSRDAFDAG